MDKKYENIRDIVTEQEKQGKLCLYTVEGLSCADIKTFIEQPTQGILYDLNRLPEVVTTYIDDPKWINDYAVYLTIKALKEALAEARALAPA